MTGLPDRARVVEIPTRGAIPTTMTHLDLTLAYVNGFRAANGEDPLDTLPEDNRPGDRSLTCPVANALPGEVGVGISLLRFDGRGVPLPAYVRETVEEIDKAYDARVDL